MKMKNIPFNSVYSKNNYYIKNFQTEKYLQ